MLKSLKTEIKPTPEQRVTLLKAIGTCRFVYNLFLAEADKRYSEGQEYMGAYDFSLWLENWKRSSNGNSGGFRENAKTGRKIQRKEKIQENGIKNSV